MSYIFIFSLPVRVAQLVRANIGKCGPNKWRMLLGLNPAIDDTLNLPGTGSCRTISTLRFGSHGEYEGLGRGRFLGYKNKKNKNKNSCTFFLPSQLCACSLNLDTIELQSLSHA